MITVNLFSPTFANETGSTMGKSARHIQYAHNEKHWNGITFFTDGLVNDGIVDRVDSRYKIGWLREPQCLYPQVYAQSLSNIDKFSTILTYHADLLAHDGYTFAPYGGVWIKRADWGLRPKSKIVSMLYGTKMATEGHILRHTIANLLGDKHGIDYYGYRGTPTDYGADTKRRVLKEYAFSIVIEACNQENLFTEILLDCFAVGTIPIFWGCPNIGHFFDARGIIAFTAPEQLLTIVPHLSHSMYQYLLPYAKNNLAAVEQYEIAEDWIFQHVLKGKFCD